VSPSQIIAYRKNPLEWFFKYVKRRVPRLLYQEVAPTLGKRVHSFFERRLTGWSYTAALEAYNEETLADHAAYIAAGAKEKASRYKTEFRMMRNLLASWAPEFEWEILAVEKDYEVACPLGPSRLVYIHGIIDFIPRIGSKLWSGQHRTLNSNQNIDDYVRSRARNPYELIYNWVLRKHYPNEEIGGTFLNLLRKTSIVRSMDYPQQYLHQQPVPINIETAFGYLASLSVDLIEMCKIAEGVSAPRDFPENDIDPYTRKLSPYFDVMMGKAHLDDDSLFENYVPHYVPAEEQEIAE
jgi:hypothetical protein